MTLVKLTKEYIEDVPKQISDQDIIRSAIMAEFDAISLYNTQIENLDNAKAKDVLRHIVKEEKEHAAELLCILFELDSDQAEVFTKVPMQDSCIKD